MHVLEVPQRLLIMTWALSVSFVEIRFIKFKLCPRLGLSEVRGAISPLWASQQGDVQNV